MAMGVPGTRGERALQAGGDRCLLLGCVWYASKGFQVSSEQELSWTDCAFLPG